MNKEKKFEQWAERELRQNLGRVIYGDEQQGWTAFAHYHIKPLRSQYQVKRRGNFIGLFGSRRSALSWCIADHYNQHSLSYQILNLDIKKQLIDSDIACRVEVANRSRSANFQEIIHTKLETKIALNRAVSAELEKCISSAKYIQIRGFSNETARTSHA